jgi:glycerophosphoryl diester phosphodiesterase
MILLDPLARPVVGHRGNRAHAPEDTLPSLLEAVALGVDAVEFDVHLSRDGQLMVMHDPTLDRTTEEKGPLASRTADELRRIDAGYWFTTDRGRTYPWRGRGATIPSFDEVVESLPRSLPLIIELKTPAATEAIRAAIRRHALAPRVIVAGFSAQSVRPLRGEGFAIGASTGDVVRALPRALTGRQVTPTCDAFCIPPTHNGIPVPIRAIVNALRASQTVVHVWTINERRQALRLWQAGVNGIISDDPGAMLDERRTLGGSLG